MFFVCAVRKEVYDKAKQAYEGNDKISEAEIGPNEEISLCDFGESAFKDCSNCDEKSVASYNCEECEETFCELCHQAHLRLKSTQNHIVTSL